MPQEYWWAWAYCKLCSSESAKALLSPSLPHLPPGPTSRALYRHFFLWLIGVEEGAEALCELFRTEFNLLPSPILWTVNSCIDNTGLHWLQQRKKKQYCHCEGALRALNTPQNWSPRIIARFIHLADWICVPWVHLNAKHSSGLYHNHHVHCVCFSC